MYRLASSERCYYHQLGLIQEYLMEPLQKTGNYNIYNLPSFPYHTFIIIVILHKIFHMDVLCPVCYPLESGWQQPTEGPKMLLNLCP